MSPALKISLLSCNHASILHPSSHYDQAVELKAAIPIVFFPNVFYLQRKQMGISANHRQLRFHSVNNQDNAKESSHTDSVEQTGKENHQQETLTTDGVLKRLKRYGISGVLSYGLLNTAYYLSTFLFVWLYVAPAPGRMGYLGAAERFLKVMAMVWAGSQVTKLIRAGGALALAPVVDKGLSWFTIKFKFETQGKAFMAIAGFCFGLAFMVFLVLTLLWA